VTTRLLAIVCSSAMSIGCVAAVPSTTNAQAYWVPIFDGRSLSGWTTEQNAKWVVLDGSIVGNDGGDGWLRSNTQYGDFALRIEFKNAKGGNSGVFLRATRDSNSDDPSNPAGSYELQINNEDKTWATGSIENFIPRLKAVNPVPGQWHRYEVTCRGDHITALLDGVKVLDGRDQRFRSGFIGLQHHAGNPVAFRDIQIGSLGDR